jgi:hypothetical protein
VAGTLADVVDADRVARLEAAIESLSARVARLEAERDAGDAEAFLRRLFRTTAGESFNVESLRARAPIDPTVRGYFVHGASTLAYRLRALAGRQCGAFHLERIGRDNRGTIWIVHMTDDLHQAR